MALPIITYLTTQEVKSGENGPEFGEHKTVTITTVSDNATGIHITLGEKTHLIHKSDLKELCKILIHE
jgi:hypothetical protein